MAPKDEPSPFAALDEKLERIRREREGGRASGEPAREPARVRLGDGLQVGIELVAGVAFGCVLGWALDGWLGTRPWLFLLFFFLGAAAGMLNALRHLRRYTQPPEGG